MIVLHKNRIYLYIIIMHILCILVDNNFLLLHTHTGDLTLNSNLTCDLLSNDRIPCIRITQDGITLDCNGYSIIGPGAGLTIGIFVQFANNTIIKNCNVESFFEGIDVIIDGSLTVESTTFSNNGAGIGADLGGSLTLKNVLAENNRVGLSTADNGGTKLIIDNAYFCNNSERRISILRIHLEMGRALRLKLTDKSSPVLSKVIAQFRLKTPSTNHWRRMDSVRSNRALISLLSKLFFQICDFGK